MCSQPLRNTSADASGRFQSRRRRRPPEAQLTDLAVRNRLVVVVQHRGDHAKQRSSKDGPRSNAIVTEGDERRAA
ncbi:hypothetical protein LAUMK13_05679 [Mycobacterium innocens]|uniref:Uncharacterized protein n=1 Tax=Mycobacterium innocens TaxID=2341083 RepID=A0A498QM03_9MYCO|nr:hypothetical protein LAUMK13_05679 [Mycobacterium innocens]